MPVRCEISDKVNSFSSAGAGWSGVWGSAMSVFMPPLLVMATNARELDVVVLTNRPSLSNDHGHMSIVDMACGRAEARNRRCEALSKPTRIAIEFAYVQPRDA